MHFLLCVTRTRQWECTMPVPDITARALARSPRRSASPENGRIWTVIQLEPNRNPAGTRLQSGWILAGFWESGRFATASTTTASDHKSVGFRQESGRDPTAPASPGVQGLAIGRMACRQRARGGSVHGVRRKGNAAYHFSSYPYLFNLFFKF